MATPYSRVSEAEFSQTSAKFTALLGRPFIGYNGFREWVADSGFYVSRQERSVFTIRFFTQQFRPDLSITLRGDLFNNWQDDVPGIYEGGAWVFQLPFGDFPNGIQFKFRLERQYWQQSIDNLHINPVDRGVYDFGEADVKFPIQTEVMVENSRVQRQFLQPNLDENQHYDVIVIGSGMGGGVVAEQLADFGKQVLVLEAGSYIFPTHTANLPRRQVIGKFDKHLWQIWPDFQTKNFQNPAGHAYQGAAGFNLGGRSVFWGALIPVPSWWELDSWPTDLRYELEDSYFNKAQDLMKLSRMQSNYQSKAQRWFDREFPDLNVTAAPMAVQRGDGESRTLSAGIFNTASLLMEAVMTGDTDLTINLNHAVNQLLTDNGRVTGVVAFDLISRQNRTFHADTVILAAGSVESSKIAQLSNLTDPSGKIGKGFTDHQVFYTHFGLPASHELFEGNASAKIAGRYLVQTGQQAGRFLVVAELGADFNQGRYIDPELAAKHVAERRDEMLCEIVFLCATPLIDENIVQQRGPAHVDSTITMMQSHAADGLIPEMDDLKNSVLQKLTATVLPNDNHNLNLAPLGGVAHEAGTLRMGENRQGVLDPNLKFNDYDNLFCCDLSAFPTSPAANPSLTLVALALRLADHLR